MDGNIRNYLYIFFIFYYLVDTFGTICATRDGDLGYYCKVYYATGDFDEKVITCIHGDEFDPSMAQWPGYVIKSDCDIHGMTVSDKHDFHEVKTLESVGCLLEPGMFDHLLPLPQVRRFDSKQNLKYLTSELIDYGLVLPNDTFKGLCRLHTIDLSYTGIRTVEPHVFRCNSFAVRHLNLSNNDLESLPSKVFQNMWYLKELLLGDNHLGELSLGLFDKLNHLVALELQSNNISHLPEGIFRDQTSLERLILSDNRLTHLGRDIFANLRQLVRLELANNQLTKLGGVFYQNAGLQYLDVSWNDNLKLSSEDFRGLRYLNNLNLEGCGVDNLTSYIFLETVELTNVYLNANKLNSVAPGTFNALRNLVELVLSGNRIDAIRHGTFSSLRNLEVLVLTENRIKELSVDALQGQISLITLDLSRNAIKVIDGDSLDDLEELEILDLSHNFISSLKVSSKRILSGLTKLEYLYMANNTLKRITDAFVDNKKLCSLVLNHNINLELDSRSFAGLRRLKHLHMESCNLHSLPEGMFNDLVELQTLHLQNNFIKEIYQDILSPLEKLRTLHLEFNYLASLEGRPFKNLRSLQHLYMSNNKLSTLNTRDLSGLVSLRTLDVSCNHIQTISSDSFDALPQLATLNVSHNSLREIGGWLPFQNNAGLSKADLSHNFLTDISNINWWDMEDLYEFSFNYNLVREVHLPRYVAFASTIYLVSNNVSKIRVVSEDGDKGNKKYYLHLHSKLKIHLSENPLPCDCDSYELYAYAKEHKHTVEFSGGLPCQYPEKLWGRELTSLKKIDFVCNVAESCPTNCSCIHTPYDGNWIVNCTGSGYYSLPNEIPLNTNVLFMDHNNLHTLAGLSSSLWENLKELSVENNAIGNGIFQVPIGLKFLGLKGNRLTEFPLGLKFHMGIVSEFKVTLANNPWPCTCSILSFQLWLSFHKSHVPDSYEIRCMFASGKEGPLLLFIKSCHELEKLVSSSDLDSNMIYGSCAAAAFLLTTAVYFCHWYRKRSSANSTSTSSSSNQLGNTGTP